jgi:hypothetical protein
MLIVDPKSRPTAFEILQKGSITRRNQSVSRNNQENYNDQNAIIALTSGINHSQLLSTIRLPKNLKQLTQRLPKSQYDDEHLKRQISLEKNTQPISG